MLLWRRINMLRQKLHTIYAVTLLGITFLMMFPFFMLFSIRTSWNKYAYRLTHIWAIIYFPVALFKVKVEFEQNLPKGPKIFCANHFSFLDVATMPLVNNEACFIGKSSIKKIPIFGLFFSRLHISVNRSSTRDRAKAMRMYKENIANGKSLFVFPEGGIKTVTPPEQAHYKDGAFVTALEFGVPIVPVTIATNWIVLPDDGKFLIRSRTIRIKVHKPIHMNEGIVMKELRDNVRDIIQTELDKV